MSRFRTSEEEKLIATVKRFSSLVEIRAKGDTHLKITKNRLKENIRQHIACLNKTIDNLQEEIDNQIEKTLFFRKMNNSIQSFTGSGPASSQYF